jgi:hypothetical protein
MPRPFRGTINLDIRDSTLDWDAFLPDRTPESARPMSSSSVKWRRPWHATDEMPAALASRRNTATRRAIEEFVETIARALPTDERVAVFDNDGTIWCEKPMPIELGFILQRLAEMAEEDASFRDRQPWQSAYERDYEWLGEVVTSITPATTATSRS